MGRWAVETSPRLDGGTTVVSFEPEGDAESNPPLAGSRLGATGKEKGIRRLARWLMDDSELGVFRPSSPSFESVADESKRPASHHLNTHKCPPNVTRHALDVDADRPSSDRSSASVSSTPAP